MISFVHAIYVLILDIFFNKIAFSAFFFNETAFIFKCGLYFLMYFLSNEEIAISS